MKQGLRRKTQVILSAKMKFRRTVLGIPLLVFEYTFYFSLYFRGGGGSQFNSLSVILHCNAYHSSFF
jgi:hypothetical protein